MTEVQYALTIEELVKLAKRGKLYIGGNKKVSQEAYYSVDAEGLQFYCYERQWRPDQNWQQLGVVIAGMAAIGFRLQLTTGKRVDGSIYHRAEYIGDSNDALSGPARTIPLAICCAALAVVAERDAPLQSQDEPTVEPFPYGW